MIPRRLRRQRLLHDAGKLAAIVVLAGGGGLALGGGLSRLSGGSAATPGTTAAQPATTVATVSTPTVPATGPRPRRRRGVFSDVNVRVLSAVLHPAATAAGRQHNRARLTVRIVVENRGTTRVTPPRPSLVAAGRRVPTDFHADAPDTRLGSLAAGSTASVDLVFELAGAETTQLTQQRSVKVLIAGHAVQVPATVGVPVTAPATATTGAAAP